MRKILFLLPILLFASVSVNVNKKHINIGEELIITIKADGSNIEFPQISRIDGYQIIGTSVSNNIVAINGNIKESVEKSYIIMPDKNITIPSFTVKVNGKTYHTKPIKITVTTPKQTKGDYTLDINLSKNRAYLGENLILTIIFKEKKPFKQVNIQQPNAPGSVIKFISKKETENGVEYKFLLLPQKSGKIKIGPFIANVGIEVKKSIFGDPLFTVSEIKYKTVYSNTLTLNVFPIPKNSVYGNFHISLSAKKRIKADTPNNISLKITGCGDFYDLPDFSLNIPNTTVYTKKPLFNLSLKNGKICGVYEKNFTVLAQNNYVIPTFVLNEYNGTLHTLKTKPLNVTVWGSSANSRPNSLNVTKIANKTQKQTSKNNTENKNFQWLTYLVLLISGIIIGGAGVFLIKKNRDELIVKIKKADEKELFNILLHYEKHPEIKKILEKLEENIYQNRHNKIDKKEIIKIIKRLRG